jgi:DNA-binding response OmpR family regulator
MNTPSILIVDDDPHILMPLEFLMHKNGFEVFVARNGTEALAIIEENTPDVVLLDVMMPDVDGYQICSQIKSQPRFDQTAVVFMSAKTNSDEIAKGYELGAALYITKPFSTRDLVKKIKELVQ